jgi:hypothetical protein
MSSAWRPPCTWHEKIEGPYIIYAAALEAPDGGFTASAVVRQRWRRLPGQVTQQRDPESSTDPDSRLYRKGKIASELRFMGHTLMENRNGLIVDAMVTQADGYAEREAAKAMVSNARQRNPDTEITLGADKSYERPSSSRPCKI